MQSITITIGPKKYKNQFDHVFKNRDGIIKTIT